ncbi:hypothetical protein ACH3XW_3510 [Acanthocheilonema viteae]
MEYRNRALQFSASKSSLEAFNLCFESLRRNVGEESPQKWTTAQSLKWITIMEQLSITTRTMRKKPMVLSGKASLNNAL